MKACSATQNSSFLSRVGSCCLNGVKTSAQLTKQLIILPCYITAKAAGRTIVSLASSRVTILEHTLTGVLASLIYWTDAMTHGSECGVASALQSALAGNFSTTFETHWNKASWTSLASQDYWTSLYQSLINNPNPSLWDKWFIDPARRAGCTDLRADMKIIAPVALIILASFTTRIAYSVLKGTLKDIRAHYSTPKTTLPTPAPSLVSVETPPVKTLSTTKNTQALMLHEILGVLQKTPNIKTSHILTT